MRKPCNDCPFMKSTPLDGSPDWLEDIVIYNAKDPFFEHSCHKTDPNADGFKGGKKKLECKGHLMMIMNDVDKTPGKGGVYKSIKELVITYLNKWLGEETVKKLELDSMSKFHISRRV